MTTPKQARVCGGAPPRTRAPSRTDLAAAELAFVCARWHLCFEFLAPQPATFAGTGSRFTLDPLARDRWTVGFCQPGTFDRWQWKSNPPELAAGA